MSRHLPIADDTDAFVYPDLCGPCGGQCCQQWPGAAFPEDFGPPEDLETNLLEAFMTGRWTLDRSHGEHGEMYVRPEGSLGRNLGRVCTFWSGSGCEIFETRPRGCRGLEPRQDQNGLLNCETRYGSEEEALEAWAPYEYILIALARVLED